MCWEENILGTYIIKEDFLISFEIDYWAIDVFMTSREIRKSIIHANLTSLRHEFPGNPEYEISANIRWNRQYLSSWIVR